KQHQGQPEQIAEVVCDMSKAFLSAVDEELPNAEVTIDWFHVVQIFNKAVDQVRKQEGKDVPQPKSRRWAVLKNLDNGDMTRSQLEALKELLTEEKETGKARLIKEKLRWIRDVKTPQQARWRLTHYINYAKNVLGDSPLQSPMYDALKTLKRHSERIVRRITSDLTNVRLEGMNSLFQAARARARGYRNTENFINMIYLIGSPIDAHIQSGKST
ncbi:MAG: ISL3 family transposase, partial [Sphingomonadaceae bacterium]|nr:ISL3 family transposase [Sphingomonadaceae bacterium]